MTASRTAIVLAALAVLSSFAAVQVDAQDAPKKIVVDVYYESLCPDSMNFINNQLAPSYPELKDHIHVNFVPFGKASWSKDSRGRPTFFSCQHGPSECHGNQVHACVLNMIETTAQNEEEQQQKSIEYIDCSMSRGGGSTTLRPCGEKFQFHPSVITKINTCGLNNEGKNLLVQHGEKTYAVEKPLSFVPTIVIDGEKNSDAFSNFSEVICGKITAAEKPSVCKS